MEWYNVDKVYDFPILYFCSGSQELSHLEMLSLLDRQAGRIVGETGLEGLKIDFNSGLRLQVPGGSWHITIRDYDTESIFFDDDVSEKTLISMEKYFIRWQVDAYYEGSHVFSHVLDLEGQKVLANISGGAIGDTVLLLSYIRAAGRKYRCRIILRAEETFHSLVREYYPEFELQDQINPQETYASYYLGPYQQGYWFLLPYDARLLPSDQVPRLILGLPEIAESEVWKPTASRQIREPYVCIAVQGSAASKAWLYPGGWDLVAGYLKELGYRVLCIDRDKCTKQDEYLISMPEQAEDFTGNLPLTERINLLAYADFFIGLSSGLSWLAHAAGCPVVLISGLTMPFTEFDTPYRVMNRLVCHGCYNDVNVNWKEDLCPYHQGTERELECTKKISPRQVIAAIDRLRSDRGLER